MQVVFSRPVIALGSDFGFEELPPELVREWTGLTEISLFFDVTGAVHFGTSCSRKREMGDDVHLPL